MTVNPKKVKRVLALTTISLKTILNLFQYDPTKYIILRLRANGSIITNNPQTIEEKLLGIKVTTGRITNRFDMNYSAVFDKNTGEPTNPIDASVIQYINNQLASSAIHDVVVSELEVRITDEELKKIEKTKYNHFHVKFKSDPTDSELDKAKVKEHPENIALIQQSRMQYRILNCYSVIDSDQVFTKPKRDWDYQIHWMGQRLESIKSPLKFVMQLRTHLGEYSLLKEYDQSQEDKLVLISVSR